MHLKITLIISVLSIIFIDASWNVYDQKKNRFLNLEYYDVTCKNKTNLPMEVLENRLEQIRTGVIQLSGKIKINKLIPNFKIKIIPIRCRVKENPLSCERFSSRETPNLCIFLNMGKIYPNIVKNIKPKLSCPIKKGIYHLVNITQSADFFFAFLQPNWFWKVRMEFINPIDNSLIFCCHLNGKIIPFHNKN